MYEYSDYVTSSLRSLYIHATDNLLQQQQHNEKMSCTMRRIMSLRNATAAARLYHSSSPQYTLHHEWIGDSSSKDSIVFLHGLLGNGKNLKTLANKVVVSRQKSGVLLDLRGHGRSSSQQAPHTFDACVQDVHNTLPSVPSLIVGHSWGGRIALQYVHSLLGENETLPELWLLDTVPGQAHDSVNQVLEAVQRIKDLSDKQKVALQLEEYGLERGVAQWLAASLQKRGNGGFQWGFDVDVVKNVLPEFQHQDFIGMVGEIAKEGGRVNLVKGGANAAWDESPSILSQLHELEQAHRHHFQVHTLQKAGHWVHVDDLPGLLELVESKQS
jgi:hypothetical protein